MNGELTKAARQDPASSRSVVSAVRVIRLMNVVRNRLVDERSHSSHDDEYDSERAYNRRACRQIELQ